MEYEVFKRLEQIEELIERANIQWAYIETIIEVLKEKAKVDVNELLQKKIQQNTKEIVEEKKR